MLDSLVSFFVQLLAGDLEYILESSFYLSYYAHMQPSEIDRLSTYEFRKYVKLMSEQVKADRDYNLSIAQNYGGGLGSLFQQKNNI